MKYFFVSLFLCLSFVLVPVQSASAANILDSCTTTNQMNVGDFPACQSIDTGSLGFKIPSLGDILTFTIRAFFVIAGLAALFYMLLGAFAWVTSGGDADAVGAAQQKIQAAVLGLIIIVAVLAIVWTLEQVIFARRICLGLSCPVTLPGIIESTDTDRSCCACVNETTGQLGDVIDAFVSSCDADGTKKGTVTD